MKIKDIFYIVCELCGNNALAESIKNSEVSNDNSDIKRMINCYNLVISELSEEVEPLIFSETLSSLDEKFYFSNFAKTPRQVLNVLVNGKEKDFKVYPDYVKVEATQAEIIYDYVPKTCENLDSLAEYDGIFSERVLALGVASEYLLVSGLYQEALMMREKFEKAITSFKQKQKLIIKARRWV